MQKQMQPKMRAQMRLQIFSKVVSGKQWASLEHWQQYLQGASLRVLDTAGQGV